MGFDERVRALTRVGRYDAKARETAGRRLLATLALSVLLAGMLAALGLAMLVPLVLVAATLVGIAGAVKALLERSPAPVLPATSRAPRLVFPRQQIARRLRSSRIAVARLSHGVLAQARVQAPRLAGAVVTAVRQADAGCEQALKRGLHAVARLPRLLLRLRAELGSRQAQLQPNLRRQEASRLNAQGSQFRRQGQYARAAERHRAALETLRELGDRRAEALTLNNLALAIEHTGDGGTAVDLFEEAAGILGDLRDKESEGQVIANLGLAQRRCGRRDEGTNLLQSALEKLSPDSSAYRAVEAELRRAS